MAGSEGTSPRLLVDTLTLALYNLLILVGIFVPFCGKSISHRDVQSGPAWISRSLLVWSALGTMMDLLGLNLPS